MTPVRECGYCRDGRYTNCVTGSHCLFGDEEQCPMQRTPEQLADDAAARDKRVEAVRQRLREQGVGI